MGDDDRPARVEPHDLQLLTPDQLCELLQVRRSWVLRPGRGSATSSGSGGRIWLDASAASPAEGSAASTQHASARVDMGLQTNINTG